MDELKVRLVAVADLEHRPQLLGFWLAEMVVDHVSTDQHYSLLEEQLSEEGEYNVGMRILPSLLEVLHIRAELSRSNLTKQSFCHCVMSLKCPPFLKTGSRKKGALLALRGIGVYL